MKNLLSLFFGMKYCDTKKLKEVDHFIIVSNHNSHLDTMTILSSLPASVLPHVHPVAAGDYFNKYRVLGFLVRIFVNVVYVYRDQSDKGSNLDYLDNHLKSGRNLILFPEGTRGEPDQLQSFRSGVGVLLKNNPSVKFVPVYIDGVGKMMPRGDGLPIPTIAHYKMGDPVDIAGLDIKEINDAVLKSILDVKNSIL